MRSANREATAGRRHRIGGRTPCRRAQDAFGHRRPDFDPCTPADAVCAASPARTGLGRAASATIPASVPATAAYVGCTNRRIAAFAAMSKERWRFAIGTSAIVFTARTGTAMHLGVAQGDTLG